MIIYEIAKQYENDIWFEVTVQRDNVTKELYLIFNWFKNEDNFKRMILQDRRNFRFPLDIKLKRLTNKRINILKEWLDSNKEKLFDIYQEVYEKGGLRIKELEEIVNGLHI